MEYGKKFIIIGSQNAITYKDFFPYIKNNELWLGMNYVKEFRQPNGEIKKFGNICWFTNLENEKHNRPIDLYKHYSNECYPKYDNYDAIEVSETADIPMDYDGVMGVPITFLDKYCPDQFEIVGWSRHNDMNMDGGYWLGGKADATINGKEIYRRILIRHRKAQLMEYGKKFIVLGNMNAITYKEIFPLIKNNEIWLGYTLFVGKMPYFQVPLDTDISKGNYYYENGNLFKQVNSICWFTNLDHNKRHRPIDLYKHYSNEYKHYDNYDAIEVGKTCEIPMDYDGVMGVPITFLDKYCPDQFEIVGCFNGYKECDYVNGLLCGQKTEYIDKSGNVKIWTGPTIDKKTIYFRILIKRK